MCLWVMRYFVDWGTLKAFSRSKMLIISRFSLSKRRDPSFILVFLFTHASKIHGVKDHLDEIVGKKSEDLDEKLTTIAKVNSFLVYWVLLHYSEEEFLVVSVLCDHWLMLATLRLFCSLSIDSTYTASWSSNQTACFCSHLPFPHLYFPHLMSCCPEKFWKTSIII